MPPTSIPPPSRPWPVPKLHLRIDDLQHEGADIFLNAVNPSDALHEAVVASFQWLYTLETAPRKYEPLVQFALKISCIDGSVKCDADSIGSAPNGWCCLYFWHPVP